MISRVTPRGSKTNMRLEAGEDGTSKARASESLADVQQKIEKKKFKFTKPTPTKVRISLPKISSYETELEFQ